MGREIEAGRGLCYSVIMSLKYEYAKGLLKTLGFLPKENAGGVFQKKYAVRGAYAIEVDFGQEQINYGALIRQDSKTTQNFAQPENFVVLECVDRLLERGYKPQNIILEKTYPAGHGVTKRLDILVLRDDGSAYLMIECKTYGKEFNSELLRVKRDGGQLFTYFQQDKSAEILMLYASELKEGKLDYRNEIIKIEEDYRQAGNVEDLFEKWNKLPKNNGVWENPPYNFKSKAKTISDLKDIRPEDSSFIFNRFLEILRHNVVSDKPNAFNKIFTLFLCKIYDEKDKDETNEELHFQWLEGKDDNISFQLRLTDLYKNGMKSFLGKKVTDFSDEEFENQYGSLFTNNEALKKKFKENVIHKLRLEKNNEFAIKEVYDEKSFKDNAKVVKEVVELLQGYKIRYTTKQQYLSDFFELLLTTGLKQESGQFFTPVPIAQFIIKSLPIDKKVKDKLTVGKDDDLLPYVIDYAAGSGHFLTESMHEIQRLMGNADVGKLKVAAKELISIAKIKHFNWAEKYIYGIEKDYRLVKVGKVGCYLHGDGLANVIHSDGLANFKYDDYKIKLRETDKYFPKENKQFDILVSNPPYSVSAFKNAARDYYTEKDFDLYDSLTDNSSEIECLFVERAKQLLKDGGVAGIILPSSILSNEGVYTKTREIILQYFEIIAITELGSNTFMATGTNTVVLFLRRRNNYDCINLKIALETFFQNFQDVTRNGIEKPVVKYVNHVWDGLAFDDYITLLKKTPNNAIAGNEIYKEYRKKIKAKTEKDFWNALIETEKEKLLYFILAFPQKVVLVKTGEKDAEKRFLGYEFSNRRGSEGIHPVRRGKTIDECTRLFDENIFENPEKASTYIYKAFAGDYETPVHESLQNNISRACLVDMLTFDRGSFTKNISTVVKKKVKIESRWEIVKLNQVVDIVRGASPRPIKEFITYEPNGINWIKIGDVIPDSKYVIGTEEKITKEGAEKSRFVNEGDFILSNSMSFGRPYILKINGCIHDGWLQMANFAPELNKDYFYYILSYKTTQEQFIAAASGGTSVDNLNIEKVSHIQIPLPPLEIQQKIVAEIEGLEIKERKAKAKITGLQEKMNEIISSRFSQEYKFDKIMSLEYGVALPDQDRIHGSYPVAGSNGIVGYHNEFLVEAPAIVVGRKGSAGKINWIDENCTPIDTTFFVKKADDVKYSLKILFYALNRLDLESLAGGTGVPGLNRNDVYAKMLKLPPLAEQQKITAEIEKIEARIAEARGELDAMPERKSAILQKYLQG